MRFSVMFFASDQSALGTDRYRLVMESAKFADTNDFLGVWVPERHFTALGSLYPNPAVLHAALARETTNLRLCAGSVVLPIHNPIRVVEEWSMVDNFSKGRVGLSFASGWNPDDFAFFPDRYETRSADLYPAIDQVRRLWRGEPAQVRNGVGQDTSVRVYPAPIQPELPFWVTAASRPQTFERAGSIGARLLTHLLDQDVETLAGKLEIYRAARAKAGLDPRGHVTIMLHTYVGRDWETTIEQARGPYVEYIKSNIGLLQGIAHSRDRNIDVKSLSPAELDTFTHFLYDRFVSTRALIGTPQTCLPLVESLARVGVDEIACLLDFGPPVDLALQNLENLNDLRKTAEAELVNAYTANAAHEQQAAAAVAHNDNSDAPANVTSRSRELAAIIKRCTTSVDRDEFYDRIEQGGAAYGTTMRTIDQIWMGDGEVLGRLTIDPTLDEERSQFAVHPTLLDNCFLLLANLTAADDGKGGRLIGLPRGVGNFTVHGPVDGTVWSHIVPGEPTPDGPTGDVLIFNEDGTIVAEARGLAVSLIEAPRAETSSSAEPELTYALQWDVLDDAELGVTAEAKGQRWLLFADRGGYADALARTLVDRGATALCVDHGAEYKAPSGGRACVRPGSRDDIDRLLDALGWADTSGRIAHMWSLDVPAGASEDALACAQSLTLSSTLSVVQALVARGESSAGTLYCITRAAQTAGDGRDAGVMAPAQASQWGLGRVIGAEHPALWGGLVDLAVGVEPSAATTTLCDWLVGTPSEHQVLIRGSRHFVPRLVPNTLVPSTPIEFDHRGGYLITGGLGDLGLQLAQWMADRGARHLSLVSRGGRDGLLAAAAAAEPTAVRRLAALEALEASGAVVDVVQADISRGAELDRWLAERAERNAPPIRGVMHLAAVVHGGTLTSLVDADFERVMRPKAHGGVVLHERLAKEALDFFVMFSAVPGVIGWIGAGAGNYAAANAFLDGLALYRRAKGSAAATIDYGPWNEIGMAAREDGLLGQLERVGIGSMTPAQGLTALEGCMSERVDQAVVVSLDWPKFFAAYPNAKTEPLLRPIQQRLAAEDDGGAQVRATLAATSASMRVEVLEDVLKGYVGRALSVPQKRLASHRSILTLGLDSLTAIEIKTRIEADLGVTIPIVQLLKGPSITQLAERLIPMVDLGSAASSDTQSYDELVI